MYCGICVDVCPFEALAWVPEIVGPAPAVADLTLGTEALAGLVADPPPG